jgi:hypothetical protein
VPAHADPDTDAKFIQVLDDGNVPYKNTRSAIALAHAKNPRGVAVDSAGNVYIPDGRHNRVLKLPAG